MKGEEKFMWELCDGAVEEDVATTKRAQAEKKVSNSCGSAPAKVIAGRPEKGYHVNSLQHLVDIGVSEASLSEAR
jgi:hypothetical protein